MWEFHQINIFIEDTVQEQTDKANTYKPDIKDQLANTFEAIPQDMDLKNIVEKMPERRNISVFQFNKGKGFPQAKRRDVCSGFCSDLFTILLK